MTTSSLLQLSDIISQSLKSISDHSVKSGISLPAPDGKLSLETEGYLTNPDIAADIKNIISAASQLVDCLTPTHATLLKLAQTGANVAALRVAIETHVAEILAESPHGFLNIKDIASFTKTNPEKLGRLLRLLASQNIFRQVAPDVFSNTRLSSALDSGKSIQDLLSSPKESKYDGTSAFLQMLLFSSDELTKTSIHLPDIILDPRTTNSTEIEDTAFVKALNIGPFSLLVDSESPAQRSTRRRCIAATPGIQQSVVHSADERLCLSDLPADSLVVAVGMSGRYTVELARQFPQLKYVIQDTLEREDAFKLWGADRDTVASRIGFQVHNMFDPQPTAFGKPAVFILNITLVSLSDIYATRVLKNLREAAHADTRLLITQRLDAIESNSNGGLGGDNFAHANVDLGLSGDKIEREDIVNPILAQAARTTDIMGMALNNGKQRRREELRILLEGAGWRTDQVTPSNCMGWTSVEAVPISLDL